MKIGEGKKIAIWGTGNISRQCLRWHSNIYVDVFIDNNKEIKLYNGVPVVHPSEMSNWKDYFVIIAVQQYESIVHDLESKGLIQGTDFASYDEFWGREYTVEGCLESMREWRRANPEFVCGRVIYAPIFICRQADNLQKFFKAYINNRLPDKCVVISMLGMVDEVMASDAMGAPVFGIPDICDYNGMSVKECSCMTVNNGQTGGIDTEWINNLEKFKKSENSYLAKIISENLYYYVKEMLEIINPHHVLIWGSWTRFSLILEELSKRNNIPYGFMEYGWVPGTIQFDKGGMAGRSEYAIRMPHINNSSNSEREKFYRIKEHILINKTDTGIFYNLDSDTYHVQKLNQHNKTIFFIGMGDDGIQIAPNSDFWNSYISELFNSTKEAVYYVYDICCKNGWNMILKPHPSEDDYSNYTELEVKDNFALIRGRNVDELIEISDVVISIASAVDYKVLLYEKPLVHVGHSSMQKVGCDYYASYVDELEDVIKAALDNGMTDEQKTNYVDFVMWLLKTHLWDDLSEREQRYGLTNSVDFFDV
jgi:hypothetical protein